MVVPNSEKIKKNLDIDAYLISEGHPEEKIVAHE